MIGTRNWVTLAIRLTPPKMTVAASTMRTSPTAQSGMENTLLNDSLIVFACTALKMKPKQSVRRMANTMPRPLRPSAFSM